MPRNSYSRDPRWITARFASECSSCGARVVKGEPAVYWPSTRSVHCSHCGSVSYARFELEAADEEFLTGGAY